MSSRGATLLLNSGSPPQSRHVTGSRRSVTLTVARCRLGPKLWPWKFPLWLTTVIAHDVTTTEPVMADVAAAALPGPRSWRGSESSGCRRNYSTHCCCCNCRIEERDPSISSESGRCRWRLLASSPSSTSSSPSPRHSFYPYSPLLLLILLLLPPLLLDLNNEANTTVVF